MTEHAITSREIDVIELCALGHTKLEIADQLGITENTVRTHIKRLAARWNARNTCQLVAIAKDEGYI